MTLQALGGVGGLVLPYPVTFDYRTAAAINTPITMNATGQKMAFVGRYAHPNRASTSAIRKVWFLPGAITSAGGSGVTLSLQDVSLTASPLQPDETQDQTVAFLLSAMTANTQYKTAALSADRSIAVGDLLAMVIEFDGAGRLGADALELNTLQGLIYTGQLGCMKKAAGTWSIVSSSAPCVPNVFFECVDGTVGTLDGAFNYASLSSIAYNSGSAADETALAFSLPFAYTLGAGWLNVLAGTTSDYDIVLYEGTTARATVSIDANALTAATRRLVWVSFNYACTANTVYRISAKPTTVNSITTSWITQGAAAEFDAMPGGRAFYYSSRVDAGAWTDVLTKQLIGGVRVSGVDTGGGVMYASGMTGGMDG